MAKETDYVAKSLGELQEIHSRLCAEADGLGLELPDNLTVDFDSQERGAEICVELGDLITKSRANTVAGGSDIGHKESGSKPAKKRTARTAATTTESSTGVSTMTTKAKKAKKAKPAKKVAKKAAKKIVKKAAAKKNGVAKKTRTPREGNKTAEVIALMKRAKGVTRAEVLELTGWKAVSMQQLAKSNGVKLKVDESERPFKYKVA